MMPLPLRQTKASRAWHSLLVAFTTVSELLAEEMEAETGLSLERYEILLMLAQADQEAMRPSELAERRRLSRSGATRLIDRLERDGLVRRRACDGDGRGSLVALTEAGEKAFIEAGRVHLRGIDCHVGSHLGGNELTELVRMLTRISDGAGQGTTGLALRADS